MYELEIEQEKMRERNADNWEGENILNQYYIRKIETFKFSREQFKQWTSAIVYVCWKFIDLEINSLGSLNRSNKKYKIAIYVGRSSCGMSRPLGRDHHKKTVIETADELEIFPCYNEEDSIKTESDFIKYLRPMGNLRRKTSEARRILIIEKLDYKKFKYSAFKSL